MQKRKIGSSEIFVSAMGLGTVKFGRNTQVKYPCKFELPSDQDLTKLLKETYSLGINFLDTAPAYGTSEERIGKLLKGWRKSWVLSTYSTWYFGSCSFWRSVGFYSCVVASL